jgi:hypothetical protein
LGASPTSVATSLEVSFHASLISTLSSVLSVLFIAYFCYPWDAPGARDPQPGLQLSAEWLFGRDRKSLFLIASIAQPASYKGHRHCPY